MTDSNKEAPPVRGSQHEALAVFLGKWRAEGKSYGSSQQLESNPKGAPEPWVSTHEGKWHTGQFFLIQDERAVTGKNPFDTHSIMGVDADSGQYFARSFENHGFYRHYAVTVDGRVWSLMGKTERARIEFSADGRTQTITWEWRPKDRWLPLCDRTAIRERDRDETQSPRFTALGDGVPSHIEIGVPEGGRTAEFFSKLFAWPVHAMGKDNHWAQTGTGAIGIHPGDNDRNMTVYFAVADIEDAVRRVREIGGEAPEPGGAEPGFGQLVECRDPQGVRFGLHQVPR